MASAASRILLAGTLGLACGSSHAAEWAVAPQFSFDADTQSNRTLVEGTPASQSLGAGMDLGIARRSETSEFQLLPHYYLRRFTGEVVPNVDDAQVLGSMRFSFERAQLNFGAEYADESTLTTELAETGVIHADASRITRGVNVGWSLLHSDAVQFDVSTNAENVDYTGGYVGQLYGYDYAALSAGETYRFSPRTALTLTAFGSKLDSPDRDSKSRERGVSLGVSFGCTERLSVSATLGVSRREIDGVASSGTTGDLSLSHKGETRELSFNLEHSLQPFGTGVLTERDTAELGFVQDFDSRLSSITRLGYARNADAGLGTTFDSRTYRYADTELRWQLKETWYAGLVAGYASATDLGAPESVGGWSVILRSGWTPSRHVLGH
jgi:hypothetical protein